MQNLTLYQHIMMVFAVMVFHKPEFMCGVIILDVISYLTLVS